jgi:glycosyltransferase 2 family protein
MEKKKILQSLLFLIAGILLFWYVYRGINIKDIEKALGELNFGWIILSCSLSLISHVIRAMRWKLLFMPMGYKPKTSNLFLSVLVMYLVNLIVPRGGEVARCGVVANYEKVPFTKLVGTVFTERIADVIAFFLIFAVIFFWQFSLILELLSRTGQRMDLHSLLIKIVLLLGFIVLAIAAWFLLKKMGLLKKINASLQKIKIEFLEGIKAILRMENKGKFVIYTFLIYLLYFLMFYVVFFSYPPTQNVSFKTVAVTYIIGTFAFLLPIQAGIGAWHFLVIQSLLFFGIDQESGKIFALISHTFTNLIYLVLGSVGFMLLPLVNRKRQLTVG